MVYAMSVPTCAAGYTFLVLVLPGLGLWFLLNVLEPVL